MAIVTGALGKYLSKLAKLPHREHKLQKSVRKNIQFLVKELEAIQAALRTVGEVTLEQLPELVRIWARDTREVSYDMENIVDAFLMLIEGSDPPSRKGSKKFVKKLRSMLAVGKRHHITGQIKGVRRRVMDLAVCRDR